MYIMTWASAVLAGALLMLFFAWNVTQSVQRAGSEVKQATHLPFNQLLG